MITYFLAGLSLPIDDMEKLQYKLVEDDKELKEALDIRKKVFVEEQGISDNLDQDGNDSDALHVVVTKGNVAIGTVRIRFLTNQQAKLERMAIMKTSRGSGIGKRVVSFIEKELKARGIERIVLHAQYTSIDFYKKVGFKEIGLPFLEADIEHIRMEKNI
ncbi:GNAT family N-acetyltransferase [Chloroflexota bacterium]